MPESFRGGCSFGGASVETDTLSPMGIIWRAHHSDGPSAEQRRMPRWIGGKALADILNVVHIILNDVQYIMMIKSHHRALGFGLGVAVVAVCAARIGSSFRLELVRPDDSLALVNGGAWAYLALATIAFLLGVTIWQRAVTTHPPTARQSIGLALVTASAIGFAICLVTAISATVSTPPEYWPVVSIFALIFAGPYVVYNAGLPLLGFIATWTWMWRTICAVESAVTGRTIRGQDSPR
jgi:hypothetical protein